MQVVAVVGKGPHNGIHFLHQVIQALAAFGHELPNGEPHPDAVALRDVPLDGDAPALFPAQQHVVRDHDAADPLEPDLGDFICQAVVLAEPLHLGRGAGGHHHLAGEFLVLHQVVDQQQDDVVRVHELTFVIVQADPVRVAVRGQAAIQLLGLDQFGELQQILVDRFRGLAVEARIVVAVKQGGFRQHARQHALTRAVHRIIAELQAALADRRQVKALLHVLHVHVLQGNARKQANRLGHGQVDLGEVHPVGCRDQVLHFLHFLRYQRPAVRSLQLVPVVAGRVVAGRDDHAHARLHPQGAQRNHRRTYKPPGQMHFDALADQHLGRGFREQFAREPAIMPYHHTGATGVLGLQPFGQAHGDPCHVVHGKLLGDDGSPTVRSEFDLAHAGNK